MSLYTIPLTLLLLTTPHLITSTPTAPTSISTHPVFLIVSFDGFRHSFLKDVETPNIDHLASQGSTVPYMIPAFPTKTFPNHMSIATGLYTESHGIVDNIVYDSQYRKTLDGKRNDPGFWNYDSRVLPLWIQNEMKGGGRASGCYMWPGSTEGYGNRSDLRPTYYYPGYDEKVGFSQRVDTVISWLTNKSKPANLVYLYYNQPDGAGHKYGPYGDETIRQVKETDRRVGVLMDKLRSAGIRDKINVILLSDHGMKTVTSERTINVNIPDRSKLVQDTNGISPVIQVVPKEGMSDELYKVLESESRSKKFTVFKRSELCGEPYYYCQSRRRIHEFVTLADPGYAFGSGSRASKSSEYGSHGYVNTHESMRVFFIIRGPLFKRGYKTNQPIKNVDIVPMISKVLGFQGVMTNGSLSRVESMIL